MRYDWPQITRRWLSRFSFSFLVIAFFLGWEGYQRYMRLGSNLDWRAGLYFIGAAAGAVLGFTALRERHRR